MAATAPRQPVATRPPSPVSAAFGFSAAALIAVPVCTFVGTLLAYEIGREYFAGFGFVLGAVAGVVIAGATAARHSRGGR